MSIRVHGGFAMLYSRLLIPPKASGDCGNIGSIVWVVPVLEFILIECGAAFVITVCSFGNPTGFTFVFASLVGVAVIVSVFGAVMGNLKPFVAIAVLLCDSFAGGFVRLIALHLVLLVLESLFVHLCQFIQFLLMEDPLGYKLSV